MARQKRDASSAATKRNYTIHTHTDVGERIEACVKSAAARAGYPVSVSAWLLAQVIRGVEEEEKRTKRARSQLGEE